MTDFLTATRRSCLMSRVRGSGNSATELAMVALLRRHRFTGWRRHFDLFGRPDFAFPQNRLALFVDGCFWHGCPKHATKPATNRAFWCRKLEGNIARDRVVNLTLRKTGWRVMRVWQHDLTMKNEARLAARLRRALDAVPR
ncbi:MAG: very short patch repair endonuclease [candidate division NC10 bacterium]|nr:very short patch repair endonuclease [candidate division NC10 bacterium]